MAVRDDFSPGEVLTSSDLNDTFASKLDLAGGKILQIVRATDTTERTTTSTSLVDANISVTITPQKSDSAILIFWFAKIKAAASEFTVFAITDNSNNLISGAEEGSVGGAAQASNASLVLLAYATPATTSATTYKGRFRVSGGTGRIANDEQTGQLFAIEVSA